MKFTFLLAVLLTFSVSAQAQLTRTPRRQRTATTPHALTTTINPASTPGNRAGQTLPIRRVILYSNGVAYIERRGTIAGRAEINLPFKQSQVDDVLKSMIVLDLGQGRIGAVSYNSSAPPSVRMADIPFSISAESGASGGLAGVLSQLQGARVAVSTAHRTATGSILTVEERKSQTDTNKPMLTSHALVIAAENGELASFDLADVRSVKLIDEGARRDISEFASATASARRRDAKTITVTSDGVGTREMVVSYTIAAPIWKTTYRVVLDADGKPFFQGWAIVDNVSDEDWNDVRLSLISGSPVSFIQHIQKPFYRYRPVVPVPENLKLSPQVYEPESGESSGAIGSINGTVTDPNGAVVPNAAVTITNTLTNQTFTARTNDNGSFSTQPLSSGTYSVTISAPGFRQMIMRDVSVNSARPSNINVALEVGSVSETVTVTDSSSASVLQNSVSNLRLSELNAGARAPSMTLSAAMRSGKSGVEAAAEGSEIGDLFEYQIAQPVTVKRDCSALIPILQTNMKGERISIYNEASRRNRPMSGMLLENTSLLTLEDGALTVIDGNAYAGEALMERLKPSEKRLISFALDLGTLVNVRTEEDRAPAFSVRVLNVVFQTHFYRREKKIYALTNQTERARTIYVEHPTRENWDLDDKETPKPEGKSARYYRFRVELQPRASVELPVIEREELVETYALSNITPAELRLFVARRYIDDDMRAALQNIIEIKSRIAAGDARVATVDGEIEEIGADQKRLRENIESLTKTTEAKQLIARYVAKADQQETRIEQLTGEKQAATVERQRLQAQLDSAIRTLSLDRRL
ncbi:MAG: carboxypeptidase regulatory-like domain-containing protein [Acidobacteriota bacterium]|nr:carboxypeptidase regulatory-like domain-containing protein [Acidobacteriota bacterium]